MRQLFIPYKNTLHYSLSNFISDDQDFVSKILKTLDSSNFIGIHIYSEDAVGKTHILNALCNHFSDMKKNISYIPLKNYKELINYVEDNLTHLDFVFIDDIECIFSKKEWELSLIKIYNLVKDNNKKIIFSSNNISKDYDNIFFDDLRSRISSLHTFEIPIKNEKSKIQILKKYIERNHFNISDKIVEYLMKYHDRSIRYSIKILNDLNNFSLSNKTRVNLKNISKILESLA